MNLFKNNQGSILLLAMLVMAGVVTVSLGTTTLIIAEIQQSVKLDQSVVAYYAAESGVERSLFQARKKQFEPEVLSGLEKTLDNEANYQIVASSTEEVLYATLAEDESYQFDLYEPNSFNQLTNPIQAIGLSWDGLSSWLEVNWSCWDTNGNLGNPRSSYNARPAGTIYLNLYESPACILYRVRLIARQAAANNIQIRAYSEVDPVARCGNPPNSCQSPIPARVRIKGVGQYPGDSDQASRQAILVSLPQRSPIYGLYDYVLFSDEEIKKEN